jgi:hypothetical protein
MRASTSPDIRHIIRHISRKWDYFFVERASRLG